MASVHKTIKAIEDALYQEKRQNCKLPTEQKCADALMEFDDFNGIDTASLTHIFDKLCDQDCIEPLNAYYECYYDERNYADSLCIMQDNKYCSITNAEYIYLCSPSCEACTDDCRSCLDRFVNILSCCLAEHKRRFPAYATNVNRSDVCNNTYTTCSTSV